MEWTNGKSLEFLKLFRNEPCLWDLKLQSNKNRSKTYEAWRRIIKSLSFSVSCEELKKKKESLMGYYRIHLNKYKKSLETGNEYTTNWFAFEFMDSFLRPVYTRKTLSNPEPNHEENNSETTNESVEEDSQRSTPGMWNDSHGDKSTNERGLTQSAIRINRTHRPHQRPKTGINSLKQINYGHQKLIAKRKQYDEYDHFAFMIASKIRKIDNADDKEELMNAIHNLTFQFYMKNKNKPADPLNTISNIKFSPHYESE